MHEGICEALLANAVELLYVTNKAVEKTAKKVAGGSPSFDCETTVNEVIAVESALAGSLASKRTACLVSSQGLYEALDSLVRSACAVVDQGFLIVAVQENDEEVTPLGLYSKLPLLVTEDDDEFGRAVEYGYYISERYKIPVIIQTVSFGDRVQGSETGDGESGIRGQASKRHSDFMIQKSKSVKAPTCFPKFKYELRGTRNEKIEEIRTEFEVYEGNRRMIKDKTGLITDRLSSLEFYDEDISLLKISTVFPLPCGLAMDFINDMDMAFLAETYPVMESQIPERSRVVKGPAGMLRKGPRPEETIYGFYVVRDRLGPASSINMAHGAQKCVPEKKVLAITYEDFFFHSGIPAFVNALSTDSSYVILIMSNNKEDAIKEVLQGFGFHNHFHLNDISEVKRFQDAKELTVLFCRGIG